MHIISCRIEYVSGYVCLYIQINIYLWDMFVRLSSFYTYTERTYARSKPNISRYLPSQLSPTRLIWELLTLMILTYIPIHTRIHILTDVLQIDKSTCTQGNPSSLFVGPFVRPSNHPSVILCVSKFALFQCAYFVVSINLALRCA